MRKPTILVTGAAGLTGGAVVTELLQLGWPVRALVARRDARTERLERQGASLVVANLFDPEQLEQALRGVERAYYLPIVNPHMIQSATAFVLAARSAGVAHVVQLSQWLASPAHPSLLTRQIWLVDRLFATIPGVSHTIVNPGYFADNVLRVADFAALLGIYPVLTGRSRSAPVATEDIARVVVAALVDPDRHACKTYRPTGPRLLSAYDVAAVLERLLRSRVRPVPLPLGMFLKLARMQGVDPYVLSGFRHYLEDHRRGAFEHGGGVSDVVERVTGTPAEDFEATARRYLERPFAHRTLANRLRAFANFLQVPFRPGYNLNRLDRIQAHPVPPAPRLAIDDTVWKLTHGNPSAPLLYPS